MSNRVLRSSIMAIACAIQLAPLPTRQANACTTAVVSGAATADGRPLLWKNRDTKQRDNEVVFIGDGKYPIVAVANAGGSGSIWMGVNAAGFCIENSVSDDLAIKEKTKGPGNGGFMLLALKTCATVEEFAELCRRTDGERTTTANIGVIDAQGGAALFEIGPKSHVRFDAASQATERSYLVRSNFSMTAQGFEGDPDSEALKNIYSAGRYARACSLLERGKQSEKGLGIEYFLRKCARDLADDQGRAVPGTVNGSGDVPKRIATANTISRKTTVSAAVFHGVLPGEAPQLTTMWTFLGDPTFSIAIPCWPTARGVAPELDGKRVSELCSQARELRDACYSADGEAIDAERLAEIYRRTWSVEDDIVRLTQEKLAFWRMTPPSDDEIYAFHCEMARQAEAALESLVADFAPERATPRPVARVTPDTEG